MIVSIQAASPVRLLFVVLKFLSYIKRHREFGIKSATADFDFTEVMDRVQTIIKKVEPHDSVKTLHRSWC